MLIIERNVAANEGIKIGDNIIITFSPDRRGNYIKIGIQAPKDIIVDRVLEIINGDTPTGIWIEEDSTPGKKKCQ